MGKVRQVTLYKHGVGFFEVSHEVEGDAEVCLNFKVEEMNDVLKSLTVHDPDGKVSSISYDSHKDIAQLLKEIALEVPRQGGTAALLGRLQGAEVIIRTHTRELRGAVLGLEPRSHKVGDQVQEQTWLSLWTEARLLVSLNLSEIESLELCDENLRSDLSYCLDVMLKLHKRDGKQLSVFTRGQGKRELHVSYLVEAPAWKSSYRVLLPTQADQEPFWEGWALVDNPRDEDWEDVQLTLVAGLPVSFRHDLYSPRYVTRREVRVEREATVGPVQVAGAVPLPRRAMSADPFASSAAHDPFASADDPFGADAFACEAEADPFGQTYAATPMAVARERADEVVAQSLGELFHYRLKNPVTVKRNQSALVPIVGQEIKGGKVILYNAQARATNPFAAVELTNSTGLTLEGGPLLVIEENSYAGEAMLDTLRPDEHRIVPYAVDLAVAVESEQNRRRESVHFVKTVSGTMTLYNASLESCLYVFKNNDNRDKTLWLEHPLRTGWDLHEMAPETERSADHYRFRMTLAAKQQLEFKVMLKSVETQVVALGNMHVDQLKVYRNGTYISEEAYQPLDDLIAAISQRHDLNLQSNIAETRIRALQAEVERCRSMLSSLSANEQEARLRSAYVTTMEESEAELKTLRPHLEAVRNQISQKFLEISRLTLAINFQKLL